MPAGTNGIHRASSLISSLITIPMKLIRITPVKLVASPKPSSLGMPKASGGFDKRYATGLGRTVRQQIADQNRRLWF